MAAAALTPDAADISRIESGQRRPTLDVLLPLARAYHLPSTTSWAHLRPATRAFTPGPSAATESSGYL